MILADVLSGLVETDTDLLLAINGWRAEWADYFMYAFSGKWIWVPLYAAIPVSYTHLTLPTICSV